jgi:hypothetical protein
VPGQPLRGEPRPLIADQPVEPQRMTRWSSIIQGFGRPFLSRFCNRRQPSF